MGRDVAHLYREQAGNPLGEEHDLSLRHRQFQPMVQHPPANTAHYLTETQLGSLYIPCGDESRHVVRVPDQEVAISGISM